MTLRVGCLQLDYPAGEGEAARLARVAAALRDAPDLDLVVLPELWDVGYFAFDRYEAAARPIADGPAATLAPIAAERGFVCVAGSVVERDGERLHNTIAVLADGGVVATYRKVHLFAHESREGALLAPGTEIVVTGTRAGRIGLATCFDLRFPEQFRAMRRAGADVFVVAAAWPAARAEHWDVLTRARAIENQTPVVACNGVGPCCGAWLAGGSVIVDARGAIAARGGAAPGWVIGSVDPGATRAWREEFPFSELPG